MTTSINGGSAKIYQFPLRGRFAASQREDSERAANVTSHVRIASGSTWYHEEAVQEAERARKN